VQSGGIEAIVEPTFSRWFTPEFAQREPAVAAAVRAMIRSTSADGYISCINALVQVDNRARLHELAMPVLFIAGAQDMAAPAAEMRSMHGLLKGAEYCELNPAGHLSNIENSAGFNGALAAFLARADAGKRAH
jgi:3-oxoadipate enol-lactonase